MKKISPTRIKRMFCDFDLTSTKNREKFVFAHKYSKDDLKSVRIIHSDKSTLIEQDEKSKERKNGKLE